MRQIGPYLIEGSLGRGAMGEVLLARHPELGQYALKLLPGFLLEDEDSLQRFEREMHALARVDGHPGIVRVHSAGRTDEGQPYYVMELVSGQTLREALKEGLPLERTLEVLEEVAGALDHAHRHGVFHRDVKPANILLGDDGVIRLTDFGLARDQEASERLTRTGDMVGTPAYMAPEQAKRDLAPVGPWTDVWGVGAVLYEALVGHVPYPGETSVEIYGRLVEGAPIPAPRQLQPEVPAVLDALAMRCLERDAKRRFQSAAELAEALRWARLGEPEARPVGTTTLLLVIAGLSLVLAGLAVGALVWRARGRAQLRAEAEARLAQRRHELDGLRALTDPQAQVDGLALLLAGGDAQEEARDPGLRELLAEARQLRIEAQRGSIEAAWAAGETRLALERLGGVEGPVPIPCRPWVLTFAGQPASALAALPAGADEGDRARLAALAGDREGCAGALVRLAQREPVRARALACRLADLLPELAPVGLSEGERGWAPLARAAEALARGDAALATLELDEVGGRDEPAPIQAAGALLSVRAALARGDLHGAAEAVERAWGARGSDPWTTLECLGWAALLAPRLPELRLSGLDGDLTAEVHRRAPGDPRRLVCAGGFDRVRRALRENEPARRAAEARRVAAELGAEALAARSLSLAELEQARAGRDGPLGLLTARAAELADCALAGNDAPAGQAAAEQLELALAARPGSPGARLAQARAWRAARLAPRALLSAREGLELAPGDPALLLELARAQLGGLEEQRLTADLARCQETGEAEAAAAEQTRRRDLERPLAEALDGVAQAFRAARQAAAAGDALEEAARLEGAAVQVERAWRLGRAGADAEEREAARIAAREELGPLLAQVPRRELQDARWRLIQALNESPPARRGEAVREAERGLAPLVRGVGAPARAATALAAASASDDEDARAWAQLGLLLAGDAPARVALALRRGEAASDGPARRRAELTHALELAPELPRALLSQEGLRLDPQGDSPRPGLAPGSSLALARAAQDVDELDHVRRILGAGTRPEDLPRALELLEQEAADGDPALAHLARALLLLEVGAAREEAAARGPLRARRAADEAGQALRLRPTPSAHLLRARALARLGPVALVEARWHLRCALAAAPWATPPALLALELAAEDEQTVWVDRLLGAGFLKNPGPLRALVRPGATARRLELIGGAIGGLGMGQSNSAFAWARELQSSGLPRAGLLLRLRTGAEVWNAYDRGREDGQAALDAWDGPPGARALAECTWHLFRGLHAEWGGGERERGERGRDERRAERRRSELEDALRAACQAALAGAPSGEAPWLALAGADQAALSCQGLPCEGQVALEREARAQAHPAEEGLRDWWRRLQRPGTAQVLRARALARLRGEGTAAPLTAEGLADPWGLPLALLAAARDGDHWPIDALLGADELVDARLAVERDAAFSRAESPGDAYYWRLLWSVRWAWGQTLEDQLARRHLALEALRTPQVEQTEPEALRGLHADVALDLAGAAPAGSPARKELLAEAERLIAGLPERVQLDGSRAVSDWRRLRALVLAGQRAPAAALLGRLREQVEKDDDSGLREVLQHELAPTRAALEEGLPGLREVLEAALKWD